MKTLNFIIGLPRSGSSVIANILDQNPEVHCDVNSSLSSIVNAIHSSWDSLSPSPDKKVDVLEGLINGYYSKIDKSIVFDRNANWAFLIPLLESVLQRNVKMIVCVRNPAEILASFERARKENPLVVYDADRKLGPNTSVAARAYHYAAPEGVMGTSHRNIQDAITMGYLDRMLFIDYGRFCGSPKSQTKRMYEFFELPEFTHDYQNIVGENMGDRTTLVKNTVNCVEYLGLNLYEQYNREIFWNAWV